MRLGSRNAVLLFASVLSAFVTVALVPSPCLGQTPKPSEEDFDALQARQATENPTGVHFHIRFKNDQTTFHRGELMQLELELSADSPGQYVADNRSYDRSGRLDMDEYHIDRRDGVRDPARDYFSTLGGSIGGGLFSTPAMKQEPIVIVQDLNEWFLFEKPGRYRLYVRTPRVGKGSDSAEFFRDGIRLWTTSNILEFEVLPPDPAWIANKMSEAVSQIESVQSEPFRGGGCRVLRFLDSRPAVVEMIRRFTAEDTPCRSDFEFGILAFADRAFVIEEMEQSLIAPGHPVTRGFIDTLTRARLLRDYHPAQAPPGQSRESTEKAAQNAWRKRMEFLSTVSFEYAGRLADALPEKQSGARAVSISTLLMITSGTYNPELPAGAAELQKSIAAAIPPIFLSLPRENQELLLGFYWPSIGGLSMLPVLRQLYQNLPDEPSSTNDIVLQRILELSPDEGRNLILRVIRSGDKRFKLDVLRRLPDRTLPELDDTMADRLEKAEQKGELDEMTLASELANRYATATIAGRVKKVYELRTGWACSIQTALLAYLLRADPDYGTNAINHALDMRKQTGCYRFLLTDLGSHIKDPILVKLAIQRLADSEPELVVSAAGVLQHQGSAKAGEALWERLRQWHKQWSGRGEDLRREPRLDSLLRPQQQIEQSLLNAITEGNAWVTPPDKLQELRQLCVSEPGCQQVENKLKGWNTVISISVNDRTGVVGHASVAQYQCDSLDTLKEKLAQFPSGTVFIWSKNIRGGSVEETIFDQLQNYLAGIGMSLTR